MPETPRWSVDRWTEPSKAGCAPPIPVAPLPDAPLSMPAVPTQPPAAPAKQEDADLAALRELEAAMAM